MNKKHLGHIDLETDLSCEECHPHSLIVDEKQKLITEMQRRFIEKFCNDHLGGIRWLRNVAIDEEDLLRQILEMFSEFRKEV